jgi:hypothetical protein
MAPVRSRRWIQIARDLLSVSTITRLSNPAEDRTDYCAETLLRVGSGNLKLLDAAIVEAQPYIHSKYIFTGRLRCRHLD